jgi:hypothetical protein
MAFRDGVAGGYSWLFALELVLQLTFHLLSLGPTAGLGCDFMPLLVQGPP